MRLGIKHLIRTAVCCLFFIHGFSQSGTITGPTIVALGSTTTYNISWHTAISAGQTITVSITGATSYTCDQNSCTVHWGATSMQASINITEHQYNQPAQLFVQVGDPTVVVNPASLTVDYGSTVSQSFTASVYAMHTVTAINWQQSSDLTTWSNVTPAVTGYSFTPSSLLSSYYRCVITVDGSQYYSNAVIVNFTPFSPGIISLAQIPTYNTVPVINNTPAQGGTCYAADRVYTWEQSIDGQPWVTIGTGISYPSGALITGNSYIRRKITCNGTTLISNVLYVAPSYTSVDYENLNYVRTIDVHVANINSWYQADQLTIDSKSVSTSYLDGLGRSIQKVAKSASLSGGNWVDLVQPIVYDAAGRTTQAYLPYPSVDNPGKFKSANVSTQQATWVTTKFGEPSGAPTYSQIIYDNSPLNRVMTTYTPGQSWGGSAVGVSTAYDYNTVDENVHIWSLAYSASAIPTTSPSSIYATGSLYKLISSDEKNKQVITYSDFSGNIILKKVQELETGGGLTTQHAGWVCTYYVYDDFNQLRFTITPKAVAYLDNNSWNLTQQLVNDLCFVYGYDGKGRIISKKQPGIGESDIIYDQRNRQVFLQDANGKLNNQWQGTLYDAMDRVTSTGVLTVNMTQASLQSYVDANTGNANLTRVTTTAGLSDMVYSTRTTGVTAYVASHSIAFAATSTTSFVSEDGANFAAFIDPNLDNTVNEVVGIADNPLPAGNFVTLTQMYYDDYTQATKTYTTADNSLFDPATNLQAETLPAQASPQTRGMITCSKVKVITNPADLTQGTWLETDTYYDAKGRSIQTQNDNSLGGTDRETNRYDFQGKLWGSCVKHMVDASTQFTIVSKNTYDVRGRLTDLAKNFNNTFFKDLANYSYDEYGKMITKNLTPNYNGSSPLESLNYTYNIQGWLSGINKDYALNTNTYSQWDHFFGLDLGYDNADNQFAAKQWNGSLTGVVWKSQGDNSMRKYDYTYDNLGRFTSGLFNQRKTPADGWSNSAVNLSEYVTYADGNGNINTMKHMGVVPGTTGGVVVDDLLYTYGTTANPNTNQLSRVDERAPFAGNGQLSDFKDGSNASGSNDYTYDADGNLVQDLNKGITDGATGGVVYNYLSKPVTVTIAGKSVIKYVYDATGVKISKTVTNTAVTPNTFTTTTYDNEFVYQTTDQLPINLQFVLHEEGRMKIITPVNTAQLILNAGTTGANNVLSGKQGVFEYFIKDQLSNTRMVLTEEVQTEKYIATMELSSTADANLGTDEAKLFGKVDPNTGSPTSDNELVLTRTNKYPSWIHSPDDLLLKSALLTASDPNKKVGPNMILKVSAGDMINAGSQYFYITNDPSGSSNGVTDALNSLVNSLLGNKASILGKMNSGLINTNLGTVGGDFSNFINGHPNSGTNLNAPKAFLNVVFFDEQFNFIAPDANASGVGSDFQRVSSANDQNASLLLQKKAPKNGWVFIYLSNESNQSVYFDNLSVSQVHGRIAEENHYYAFGQKIAGICTAAFNKLPNKFNFQGDYSEDEDNTGWNEFDLRMYDPQIGRWTGADPYDEFASPYVGMGNNPVNNVDPDGGGVDDGLGSMLWGTSIGWGLVGGAIAATAEGLSGGSGKQAANAFLLGFGAGVGAYYVNWDAVGGAFGSIGNWAGGWFNSNSYWIEYDGQKVITYLGSYNNADKSKKIKEYPGTSGGEGYQNSNNQDKPDVGPVPEGDYKINLVPEFTRKASFDPKTGATEGDIGVDLLPWGNGSLYSGWGQWRARLEKVHVNSTRDNFYFHDSYKGYSHGCIETYTQLFYDLSHYKKGGQNFIKVNVKYSGPNSSTNGGTKQNPPPWRYKDEIYNGVTWPEPKMGSFPDKTKM